VILIVHGYIKFPCFVKNQPLLLLHKNYVTLTVSPRTLQQIDFGVYITVRTKFDRPTAHAVSGRLFTAKARVRAQVCPRGIFGGQSDTGTSFSPSLRFYPVNIIPPLLHIHSCIIWGTGQIFDFVAFVSVMSSPKQTIFVLTLSFYRASFPRYRNHLHRDSNAVHFFGVLTFLKSFPGFKT
jgi:hypothetical protein